jgi:hypothetical protein
MVPLPTVSVTRRHIEVDPACGGLKLVDDLAESTANLIGAQISGTPCE